MISKASGKIAANSRSLILEGVSDFEDHAKISPFPEVRSENLNGRWSVQCVKLGESSSLPTPILSPLSFKTVVGFQRGSNS
ncbi:hypothetical protein D3C87_1614110 [compost metagenome]